MRTSGIVTVLVICVMSMMLDGCVTGPSDHELISNAMVGWKSAFEKQDVDKMMAEYSENYEGDSGEGKEQIREFYEDKKRDGSFENARMDTNEAKIVIDADRATVGPILYTGNWGEIRFTRMLKKEEDNVWRVIGGRREY